MAVSVIVDYPEAFSATCIKRAAERLLRICDLSSKELNILLTSNEKIRQINEKWFNRPWPTNVISFPMDEPGELGDIVISIDKAREEAEAGLTSLRNRLIELLIHGLVHLLGEDHELGPEHAKRMEQKEFELRKRLFRRDLMADLCINVDHVATIRQARGGVEPDPVVAAGIVELAGADGIVVHLREDRRHIQDRDVRLLRQIVQTRLTLEMAATDEMIGIATEIKPDIVTLVPEKRQELTTEGGLDVKGLKQSITEAVKRLHDAGIPVSIFIDPERDQIEAAARTGAECIEIHTGRYADAPDEDSRDREFELIVEMARFASDLGLRVHAGHGLNYQNTGRLAAVSDIVEFSIGHSVISRSVFVGIEQAVKDMLAIVKGH
ncbi:MAG: pyridoxine 5'-phosphate synthase [Thermodesulfobacteria bacterium]|nr:pyridoxine 5'-phosphate synthase [Thermodesulfobacteriota bacterium]